MDFQKLISGELRGIGPSVLRSALAIASWPYGLATTARNWLYDHSILTAHHVKVPVICIGNLTAGGTGKTPMVEYLCRQLLKQGRKPTIISRGYRAEPGKLNDEAMELAQRLGEVPHIQNPNRVAAADEAITAYGADVLVLDDAFQHRRIARDLNIVLIDALRPFGYGHLLPRGLLRERMSGLRRAELVVLSRADSVTDDRKAEIREVVEKYAPGKPWIEVAHRASHLLSRDGESSPLKEMFGKRVLAFCGIGNPEGFRATLQNVGAELVGFQVFPDHHAFDLTDVSRIEEMAQSAKAEMVVCTHKDLVKLPSPEISLRAVVVELVVLAGEEELLRRLPGKTASARKVA